jgi:hypothetical protein
MASIPPAAQLRAVSAWLALKAELVVDDREILFYLSFWVGGFSFLFLEN